MLNLHHDNMLLYNYNYDSRRNTYLLTCKFSSYFQIKRGEIQPVHSGFFKVFFNRSLNAFFVLANIRAWGDIECALVCLRIKVCLSFNFAIVPDANQYTCQLLPTDKYRDPYRFALSEQFHHYAMPPLVRTFRTPRR